jgi:LPS sulfotransferase NodH
MSKYKKFAVLSTQRSGSTWVVDVLNNIDKIKAYGELFLNERRTWDVGSQDYDRFIESQYYGSMRPFSVFSYLSQLYSQPEIIGFKLMFSQIKKYPEIMIYCRLHRVRIIHLIRKNFLDVIISWEFLKMRGLSHRLTGKREIGNYKLKLLKDQKVGEKKRVMVDLDPKTLLKRLKRLQMKTEIAKCFLKLLNFSHLEIAYEDLLADSDNFNKLNQFLNVKSTCTPKTNLTKIRRGDHSSVIRNYEEIKRLLSNTEFYNLIS